AQARANLLSIKLAYCAGNASSMKSTILRNKLVLSHVRGPHDARTSEGLKEQHIAYRTFLNVYRRLLVSGCTQSNRGYPRTFRTRSVLSRGTNLLRADAHQYWLSKRNPGHDSHVQRCLCGSIH